MTNQLPTPNQVNRPTLCVSVSTSDVSKGISLTLSFSHYFLTLCVFVPRASEWVVDWQCLISSASFVYFSVNSSTIPISSPMVQVLVFVLLLQHFALWSLQEIYCFCSFMLYASTTILPYTDMNFHNVLNDLTDWVLWPALISYYYISQSPFLHGTYFY